MPVKYLMYFLASINTEKFWKIPEEKYIAPLRILNLPLVDIALTFFDSSFNPFLFDVTYFSLLSKSVFFKKLAISILLATFALFNLKSKIAAVNLLNSGVVIHSSWLWLAIFFSNSLIFVLQSAFWLNY